MPGARLILRGTIYSKSGPITYIKNPRLDIPVFLLKHTIIWSFFCYYVYFPRKIVLSPTFMNRTNKNGTTAIHAGCPQVSVFLTLFFFGLCFPLRSAAAGGGKGRGWRHRFNRLEEVVRLFALLGGSKIAAMQCPAFASSFFGGVTPSLVV